MRKIGSAAAAWVLAAALSPGLAAQGTPAAPLPLTLSRAVAISTDTAPQVRLAELRTAEALQRFRQARSVLLPSLSAAASDFNRTFNKATFGIEFPTLPGSPPASDRIGPFTVFDARFTLRQTLFDPAGWVRTQAARQAVTATRAEQTTAAEGAAQRAGLAYVRAARAEAVREARVQDLALADSLLSLARTQLRAGVSAAIDVTRAEAQRVAAEGLVQVAANQARQAQVELARSLNVDPGTAFSLADGLTPQTAASEAPADVSGAVQRALEQRPELKAEQLRRTAALTAVRSIRAEALPRVDVIADWGASGKRPSDAISTRELGLQVSVPLLDGLRRESRQAEQRLVASESTVREADLRQQVQAEVQAALLELSSGQEQQTVAAERMRLAGQELAQARERFREGVAGNIEVINAQASLIRAEDAVIDARYATAVARVNLARAVGVARSVR
jgi:outer membrane protein